MNASPPPRLHGLDAVRALALLLGIVLHGGLSFVPGLPDALWPVHDNAPSVVPAVLAYLIHVFRMSVFFLVAGVLARALFHRLGTRAFWRNRLARIAAPLLLGWGVCFVALGAVVVWTFARRGGAWGEVPPEMLAAGLSFLHLWFLYILLWLYACMLMLRALLHRMDAHWPLIAPVQRLLSGTLAGPWRSLLLALPIAAAFALACDWNWREGVPTPAYTLLPPVLPLLIYGYVFGLGWLIDRDRALLSALGDGWALRLTVGLGCAAAGLLLAGTEFGLRVVDREAPWRWLYGTAYALGLTGCTLGLVGWGVRHLDAPMPCVRYLADASYWMYVAHLPLVMALQSLLMDVPAPWALKFIAVNAATLALLLWSYARWVRPTWIGALLNGQRR
jgi:peptidoglycan/LPS O-acetylase OafA/YrhL